MHLYGIFGAGGFAREVLPVARMKLDVLHGRGNYDLVFVDAQSAFTSGINGHPVLTTEEFFARPASQRYFNIAIRDSKVRERIANSIDAELAIPFSIEASNHIRYDDNSTGEGAIFCAYSCITSNAKIGRFFHANIYSYVAHDCVVGDFVTFAPRVHCNGGVIIEDHAYIGTAAIIKEGTPEKPIVIGTGAVVGMGAVVTKSVAPYTVVVGNPARVLEKNS